MEQHPVATQRIRYKFVWRFGCTNRKHSPRKAAEKNRGAKRIHRPREILVFVTEISHFLTPTFERNSLCNRITLRARKALRVIFISSLGHTLSKIEFVVSRDSFESNSYGSKCLYMTPENPKFHENCTFLK